jgi:hypothetical protein
MEMGWTFNWRQKRGLGNQRHKSMRNARPIRDQRTHIIDQKRSMRKDDSIDVTVTMILLLHHATGASGSRRVELEEFMKRESTSARWHENIEGKRAKMEAQAKYDFPGRPAVHRFSLPSKRQRDASSLDRSNKSLLTSRKGYLNS